MRQPSLCRNLQIGAIHIRQRQSPQGDPGWRKRQRRANDFSVDNVDYTLPERSSDSRDAAAVFTWYMTLLEHMTARCEVGEDPAHVIFKAGPTLIHRVYVSAVRKDEVFKAERELDLGACDEGCPGEDSIG